MEAYLDNAATTKCFDEVCKKMDTIYKEDYGNPSSLHRVGITAEKYLKEAQEVLAHILKVAPSEIIFTSGGTEADNLAIIGTAMAAKRTGNHLITTKMEHPAVLRSMEYLESNGFFITYLSVDGNGYISIEELQEAITSETILVSIMHTNNEIGTVQSIAKIGATIKEKNPQTLFHVDAVQGFGKDQIAPRRMQVDLLSVSGHKIHGPKGTGFLYCKETVRIQPIILGGGQQRNRRSGTENVPAISGMAKAAQMVYDHLEVDMNTLRDLKAHFIAGLACIEDLVINSPVDGREAPHIVSVSIKDIRSEVFLHALEEKGIYISSGSACASNKPANSETLKAIHTKPWQWEATVRFSFSTLTTMEEIDYTLKVMYDMIPMLRKYTRR